MTAHLWEVDHPFYCAMAHEGNYFSKDVHRGGDVGAAHPHPVDPPRGGAENPAAPGHTYPRKARRPVDLLTALNIPFNHLPADKQAKLAKAMTEATLRDNYIKPRARYHGWLLYWTWNSKHSPKGFPDLVLLHPVTGKLLVRELKKAGNQKRYSPTVDQQKWLDALTLAGVDTAVWTPADWYSGRIHRELATGANPLTPPSP
ncbi:hypothetical protein SAMN05421505_12049 [Sinosporangium album]|uniref:VRR-NUC domain-containing protein n=1 Tax=Sinosporangium album TaxID=504805 RepID=A0A1G8EDD3_9ACTN|nr:VRR-NUC domain-containing protein [Sinosporangium album]SDH67888.1 hypothetical protein SAMN05421505_12049 [Sinosporangium album]